MFGWLVLGLCLGWVVVLLGFPGYDWFMWGWYNTNFAVGLLVGCSWDVLGGCLRCCPVGFGGSCWGLRLVGSAVVAPGLARLRVVW